ncbi:MAG: ATP-grasp domain-containing protein [Candidatus Porifericomitaceae bacterium WSBS_2022_MAG_OTU9]
MVNTHSPKLSGLVGIATEAEGWHSKRIASALAQLGIDSFTFSLRDCWFEIAEGAGRVVIAGAQGTPSCIIVRTIPAGSIEQITMRINILKFFYRNDINVVNDGDSISLCVDKVDCLNHLVAAGIAVVPCWVYESEHLARERIIKECSLGNVMVCKPIFGAEGRDLQIFTDGTEFFNENIHSQGVYVLQHFVGDYKAGEFNDFRVLVIAGVAVAAMRRSSDFWVTNVAQGAKVSELPLSSPICRIAEEAATAIGIDIAGVDIMEGMDGYVVLEINAIPSWRALQSVAANDIASHLASHIADCCFRGGGRHSVRGL